MELRDAAVFFAGTRRLDRHAVRQVSASDKKILKPISEGLVRTGAIGTYIRIPQARLVGNDLFYSSMRLCMLLENSRKDLCPLDVLHAVYKLRLLSREEEGYQHCARPVAFSRAACSIPI